MQSLINHATEHSVLRNRLINVSAEPIRKAVEEQKPHAAIYDDRLKTKRLMHVLVPRWYYDALAAIQGAAPRFFGQPVMIGEHEEIKVVFWDPTMALDAGTEI